MTVMLYPILGTYHLAVSDNGLSLSDHMTLGSVVATILIIDNTAQVSYILYHHLLYIYVYCFSLKILFSFYLVLSCR